MFVQFHCLSLYRNDLYRNDLYRNERFPREVMQESHAKGDASLAIITELARGLHSLASIYCFIDKFCWNIAP